MGDIGETLAKRVVLVGGIIFVGVGVLVGAWAW